MSEVISKVMPIVLLISLGMFIRYKNIFSQKSIDEIKKFLVNFVLPAVLFITFFNMDLRKEYFLISITVFVLLNVIFIMGFVINKVKAISHPLLPFTVAGCSIAFLGLSIFPSVFGEVNLTKIAIIAMGHEFFIWVISYPYLSIRLGDKKNSKNDLLKVFKTPTMIGIIIGILLNLAGLNDIIHSNQILKGAYNTIEYLSKLSTPFILIIIGYGLKLNKRYEKQSLVFIIIRIVMTFAVGYLAKYLIIDRIMEYDLIFDYAYFTFLILPPTLTLPLMVGLNSTPENEELANSIVVLNTIISIAVYLIFVVII